ncbi:hypothetical protein [Candidatus Mycoplasma haematominutum]|uniref:Uncharacterized protein n=1 Tax=Candidatus Mycoplasma haematominutum 'Birmingham 1' TaxID=1116213 RepID=G8C3I1_9MOLU|nr:hypothetical protein [Candidatus Mycoplasma haematominutum]CCE66879.1 hypothetical protein MHM_03610 [Candidatus Mycoplasma haematominutum 'Birmingham 1']
MFWIFKTKLGLLVPLSTVVAGTPIFLYAKPSLTGTTTGGGGVDKALTEKDYSLVGKELNLSSPGIPGVFLQQEGKSNSFYIAENLQGSSSNNLQEGFNLSSFDDKSWSQSLNQEIKKEQDISKVGKDQKQLYEDEVKKIQNIKINFQSAQEKVKKYLDSKNDSTPRVKRESQDNQEIYSLTPEERKALLHVFEGFYHLDQQKASLSSELQKASQGNLETITSNLDAGLKQKVKQDLSKINWSSGEVKLKKSGEQPKKKNNFYGWGTWERTPFQNFYDNQQEWLNAMEHYEKTLNLQNKQVSRTRKKCGFANIGFSGKRSSHSNTCDLNIQGHKQVVQKHKDVIEMHIAKWLLTKMGQLSSEKLERK